MNYDEELLKAKKEYRILHNNYIHKERKLYKKILFLTHITAKKTINENKQNKNKFNNNLHN